MKKQVLFLCVFVMGVQFSWSKLNAQAGGNWPPIDEATRLELDCIARKHLTNGNTSDLELKSINRGFAGYFVKYDKVKSAIRIYGAETTVILRDNLTLNASYPNDLDTRLITQSPVLTFTEENAKTRLLTTRPAIVGTEPLGTYWIKPEGDWLVAYAFLAYIPIQPNHDLFFVDAGELDVYKKDGDDFVKILGRPGSNNHNAILADQKMNESMAEDETYYLPPGEIQGFGEARVYKRFPTGPYNPNSQDLENIEVEYTKIGNIQYMERGSEMKYVPVGENDLESSDDELFDFEFTYNPQDISLTENEKYLKAFAWTKMKTLLGDKEKDLKMNVLSGFDRFLGYSKSGKLLTFGGSIGQKKPLAGDEFWIAAAGILMDHIKNDEMVATVAGRDFYAGYLHYLAQNKLLKIGSDGICNHFGGVTNDHPPYRSDLRGCLVSNTNGQENKPTRDAITTLLAEIHQHINLGPDVVEKIMSDMLQNNTKSFEAFGDKLYDFIYDIFNTAKDIRDNNQMTTEQLCALREFLNEDYFADCIEGQEVNYKRIRDVISDLMIGDWSLDVGYEPHTFTTLYVSPNIYNDFNGTFSDQPVIGELNKMKVIVKNIGCDVGEPQTLKVYWTYANMGFGWPAGWNEIVTPDDVTVSLVGGQEGVYELNWIPQDPGTDNLKVCILARLTNGEADQALKANGDIFIETNSIGDNIKYNNGIALRNMMLIKKPGIVGDPDDELVHNVIIQDPEPPVNDPNNPNNPPVTTDFDVSIIINLPPPPTGDPVPHVIDLNNPEHYDPDGPSGPDTPPYNNGGGGPGGTQGANPPILCEREEGPIHISDRDFFTKGELWLNIKKMGTETWNLLPMQGNGFTVGMDGWIKVTSHDFRLESLPLVRGVKYIMGMKYKTLTGFGPSSFNLVLKETATQKQISGEMIVIRQDANGSGINGKSTSTKDDGAVRNIVSLRPNPVSEKLEIVTEHGSEIKRIEIYDMAGRKVYEKDVRAFENKTEVLVQPWQNGIYTIKCIFKDLSEENLQFVKN